jgi:glycosidase
VGTAVELAPRDPDPEIEDEISWSISDAPSGSDVSLGSDAVESLTPDELGVYSLRMTAPDGPHELTVRAYPDVSRSARFTAEAHELPEAEDVWVSAPFNDHLLERDRPHYEDGMFSFETELEPGVHSAMFVPDGDYRSSAQDTIEVEGPERPRVTLDATVESGTVRFEADPRTGPNTVEDLDVEFFLDDRDTLGGSLEVAGTTAICPLAAIDDRIRVHAVAVGARHSIADAVAVAEDGSVTPLYESPEWTRDATMYEIFTRSFTGEADPSFRALEGRVPYLEWLGIDTLWMTPILESYAPQRDDDGYERGGPHGYHTLDYFKTASDLGTREEFESFVETCHDHGIRVVFDLVINHTSIHHPNFQMASAGVPQFEDWYVYEDDGSAQNYFSWQSIPNLDYTSLAVRKHLLAVVDEWADVVDGFRCDVAWGVPHGFWQEVYDRVKADDAEFLMLDETIPRDPLAGEGGFDLHYDTTLFGVLRDIGSGDASADALLDAVDADRREGFSPRSRHLRYIENHDEERYLDECGRARQGAAAAATLTLPGMPMVYYGQETGMTHFRKPMEWGGDEGLTQFHRRLLQSHNEMDVLRRGDLGEVEYDGDDSTVAFAREYEGERVVVALHFGEGTADVRLNEDIETVDRLTGEAVAELDDDCTVVTVDSVVVLDA